MVKRRGNNEGTIYQRQNGRWIAQVRIEGQRLGKSFSTQKECRSWIKDMQEQIENGLSVDGFKMTVHDLFKMWLESIQGSVRPRTLDQYQGVVRNHLEPVLGEIKLRELQPYQIQQLYNSLLAEGKSNRTVQLVHSVIHRALVVGQQLGLVGRNPASAVTPPKVPQKEMQVLDDNQARQLLIAAQGDRYEAMYYLAITTGLRQGELLGLKWDDIDFSSGILQVKRQLQRVPGKGVRLSEPKTKAGRRQIQLGPESVNQLITHRKRQDIEREGDRWEEHGLIFPSSVGTPTGQRNLIRSYKRLLKKAGLPNIRFHDLRHTAATLMLLNGIPLIVVSRRLGHSKPSVTLDIYGHYLPGMQAEAAVMMDELVTPVAAEWQQIGNS